MTQPVPFNHFQSSGDVIFVRQSKGLFNRIAQKVLAQKPALYTHVLLCVLPGLYMHSMPDGGVHFVQAEDPRFNFAKKHGDNWKVRRNVALVDNLGRYSEIGDKAAYYIGQKYNGLFLASPLRGKAFTESHSFCSELIARVFADLGIPPFDEGIRAEHILPAHLDEITADPDSDWHDVTEDYRAYFEGRLKLSPFEAQLEEHFPIPNMRLWFLTRVSTLVKASITQQKAIQTVERADEFISQLENEVPKMSKSEVEDAAEKLGIKLNSIRQVYDSLWNSALQLEVHSRNAGKQPPESKPLFWFVKKKRKAPQHPMEELQRTATQVLDNLQAPLDTLTDTIIRGVFGISMYPQHAAQEGIHEIIQSQVGLFRQLLDIVEAWEDLADIQALESEFQDRIAETPLTSDQAIEIVLRVMGQLRWRIMLSFEIPLREAVEKLEASPDDLDARATLFRSALSLAPLKPFQEQS